MLKVTENDALQIIEIKSGNILFNYPVAIEDIDEENDLTLRSRLVPVGIELADFYSENEINTFIQRIKDDQYSYIELQMKDGNRLTNKINNITVVLDTFDIPLQVYLIENYENDNDETKWILSRYDATVFDNIIRPTKFEIDNILHEGTVEECKDKLKGILEKLAIDHKNIMNIFAIFQKNILNFHCSQVIDKKWNSDSSTDVLAKELNVPEHYIKDLIKSKSYEMFAIDYITNTVKEKQLRKFAANHGQDSVGALSKRLSIDSDIIFQLFFKTLVK